MGIFAKHKPLHNDGHVYYEVCYEDEIRHEERYEEVRLPVDRRRQSGSREQGQELQVQRQRMQHGRLQDRWYVDAQEEVIFLSEGKRTEDDVGGSSVVVNLRTRHRLLVLL